MKRNNGGKNVRGTCKRIKARSPAPEATHGLQPGRFRQIVVPIDFSEQSLGALRYAVKLAEDSGAILHLVYVIERPAFTRDLDCFPPSMSETEMIGTAKQKLIMLADVEVEELVPVKTDALVGKPAQEIVDYAERAGADLIVIATHGRTGLAHLALGSTAEALVQLAPCPVLVLRPDKVAAREPLVIDSSIADE